LEKITFEIYFDNDANYLHRYLLEHFLSGRVILLTNWRFDIFLGRHWRHLQNLWMQGWVIDDPKEWAFVLIILTFIPLWLTGWAALSLIAWDQLIIKAALFPIRIFRRFFYKPVKIISNKKSGKTLKKKKSYKEIRPRSIRAPIDERMEEALPRPTTLSNQVIKNTPKQAAPAPTFQALSSPAPQETKSFDHSLFQFDDDNGDDFDFNFDAFDTPAEKPRESITPKPEPAKENSRQQSKDRNNRDRRDNNKRDNRKNQPAKPETQTTAPQHATGSTIDIIKQKGYEVITGATLHNNLIDFIGIADKQICICLLDKEPGDWLADEERFNDEEPLWFSESSHRISPVRKVDLARQALEEKLKEADFSFSIKPYVIIQLGNIINAEDMFEIWNDMNINVTRIDRGTPKELKLFAKTLDEAENHIDKEKFEKIKKLIRNIA
jgi:hypothetical protein